MTFATDSRFRISRALLTCQLFILAFTVFPPVSSAQDSGSVTFKDNAPPATEQQRKRAQELFAKAQQAQKRMDSIGKALRATAKLQNALQRHGDSIFANVGFRSKLSSWKSLATGLGSISPTGVTLDEKSLAAYPKTTLDAAFAVEDGAGDNKGGASLDLKANKRLARTTKDLLLQAYDSAIVEHGTANLVLRTYPYFDLVGQPSVECQTANIFSRDVKCLPVGSGGIQTNKEWMAESTIDLKDFCHTDQIEPFSRSQYGKEQVYVRKKSQIAVTLGAQCRD